MKLLILIVLIFIMFLQVYPKSTRACEPCNLACLSPQYFCGCCSCCGDKSFFGRRLETWIIGNKNELI